MFLDSMEISLSLKSKYMPMNDMLCKTREKSNFLKNGKIVIWVKNMKFILWISDDEIDFIVGIVS